MLPPLSCEKGAMAMDQAVTAGSVVAVTGASGFVGRYLVRELLRRGYCVRGLVRDRQKARGVLPASSTTGPGLSLVEGDVLDERALAELIGGASSGKPARACINLIGIIREGGGMTFRKAHVEAPKACVAMCKRFGVDRFVQMSALGVSEEGICEYQRTKFEGELLVRRSGLDWTVFRPSIIHGAGSELIEMVKGWASGERAPYFFLPYFTRQVPDTRVPLGPMNREDPVVQPVYVEDVAWAFGEALARREAIGEVYNLVGSETLNWPAMLMKLRDELPGGQDTQYPFGLSSRIAAAAARGAKIFGLGDVLPFDEGMAKMGGKDATAELGKVRAQLGFNPRGFSQTLPEYAHAV